MLEQLVNGLSRLRSVISGSDNPFKAPVVRWLLNSIPVECALNYILAKLPMEDRLKEQFLTSLVQELNTSGQSLGEFIFTEENIKALETLISLFTAIRQSDAVLEDIKNQPIENLEQIEV